MNQRLAFIVILLLAQLFQLSVIGAPTPSEICSSEKSSNSKTCQDNHPGAQFGFTCQQESSGNMNYMPAGIFRKHEYHNLVLFSCILRWR
jgi:hypothetical protein